MNEERPNHLGCCGVGPVVADKLRAHGQCTQRYLVFSEMAPTLGQGAPCCTWVWLTNESHCPASGGGSGRRQKPNPARAGMEKISFW